MALARRTVSRYVPAVDAADRPTPLVLTRKLAVLAFIKRHFVEAGQSPTLGEIANGVRTNTTRVQAAIRALEREGELIRVPGKTRGLSLPDPIARITLHDALLRLRAAGYVIDEDVFRIECRVMESSLPLLSLLGQSRRGGGGDGDAGKSG